MYFVFGLISVSSFISFIFFLGHISCNFNFVYVLFILFLNVVTRTCERCWKEMKNSSGFNCYSSFHVRAKWWKDSDRTRLLYGRRLTRCDEKKRKILLMRFYILLLCVPQAEAGTRNVTALHRALKEPSRWALNVAH